ncbi:MAG TPA: M1 family metallopeptidase [bacterium]|nr:M1 family metallopeptidase [bacterium]HNT66795.1 M1 family metallopeptidase [bacterium]
MKKVCFIVGIFLLLNSAKAQIEPTACQSVVDYQISAKLNPSLKTVEGKLMLRWTHPGGRPVAELYFHAYPNAFKNSSSLLFREQARWSKPGKSQIEQFQDDEFGYMDIQSCTAQLGRDLQKIDLRPSLEYRTPNGKVDDDETVFCVTLPRPINAGESVVMDFDFTTKLPRSILRSGYQDNFFFVSQWYPKIGVLEQDVWHCEPYHRDGEFYANFGSFSVDLEIPSGYQVGATGVLQDSLVNDGFVKYRFAQNCVHDFAWMAGKNYRMRRHTFQHPELPPVELILLVQSFNEPLADRIIKATENALKYYGLWTVPYPYQNLTIVDAPWRSNIGGMEYPTLFTIEVTQENRASLSLESLIVHECGHQFWYGVVANNEAQHAWLDEGINSFTEARAMNAAYGLLPQQSIYLKLDGFGIPLTIPGLAYHARLRQWRDFLPQNGRDIIDQPSSAFIDHRSYMTNTYTKAALVMWTLEGILGEETFSQIIKTYSQRFRFAHPKPEDFIQVVKEISPIDLNDFLHCALQTGSRCDYAVDRVESRPAIAEKGFFGEHEAGASKKATADEKLLWNSIVMQRRGEVILPVDIEITLENGETIKHQWDGQSLWHRIEWSGEVGVQKAAVDPEHKIMLDVDLANNTRYRQKSISASLKWTSLWMGWLQHFFEVLAFFS